MIAQFFPGIYMSLLNKPSSSSARSSIAIGGDDAATDLKAIIIEHLQNQGIAVVDYGLKPDDPAHYPDIAYMVATAGADGKHERGIIICGTGIGVAITANKVPGIRAAVCHDPFSAERSRKSNNCQIMTLGARVVGHELAKSLVDTWMRSEFQGGGSAPKVERMMEIEGEIQSGKTESNVQG